MFSTPGYTCLIDIFSSFQKKSRGNLLKASNGICNDLKHLLFGNTKIFLQAVIANFVDSPANTNFFK